MRQSLYSVLLLLFLVACYKVPISGRKQMNLLSESNVMAMSEEAYQNFKTENRKKLLSPDHAKSKKIQKIGDRVAEGAEEYLKANDHEKRVEGFEWEFRVVDESTVNAFCMPGGKVVFYTGIMDVAENKDAMLAAVMGHEVAHAIARHGNERMSQQIAIRVGASSLSMATQQQPELTREILLQSYGIGSTLGALSYSRKHESEADKMGLVFMAKAGYDPKMAVEFWKKMSEQGGEQPPEFLSTHPAHDTRIQELKDFLPKAEKFYKP